MHSVLETRPDYYEKLVSFVRHKWPMILQIDAEIVVSKAIESCIRLEAEGRTLNWSYVMRTTANKAIDHIRRAVRHPVQSLEALPPTREPSYTLDAELRLALVKPENVRQNHWNILWAFGEGYHITEIATATGLSEDATKKQMSRGRASLKRHYARQRIA